MRLVQASAGQGWRMDSSGRVSRLLNGSGGTCEREGAGGARPRGAVGRRARGRIARRERCGRVGFREQYASRGSRRVAWASSEARCGWASARGSGRGGKTEQRLEAPTSKDWITGSAPPAAALQAVRRLHHDHGRIHHERPVPQRELVFGAAVPEHGVGASSPVEDLCWERERERFLLTNKKSRLSQ